MAYILNLETSTKNCSVALASDGIVTSSREYAGEGYSHAEKLHVFIEEVLAECGCSYTDLDAVAVGSGPGSYTGLRIGVSSAKGLAYALEIPLISVNTLMVLASRAKVNDGLIVPMIDARRMEVYSAVFDSSHKMVREVAAEIIDGSSFSDGSQKYYFLGDCQQKVREVLCGSHHTFLEDIIYPSAVDMAALSEKKYATSDFEDVAYFEPFYLKDFIAGGKR